MAFFGMRGTGDWATDQRPMNWRKMILRQYPNGTAPLTAMMSMMKSEVVTDPQYHWWTKGLPTQAGAITGIYTDSDLSIDYTSGGTSDDFLYVKMASSVIGEIRIGHTVTLRDASDLTVDVVAKVVDRVEAGASSYLKVKLLEDDDNSTASNDLSDADRILVTGNMNAEGAAVPDAISYDPTKWFNYTQIFRTPLSITGTALETELRTNPQAYQELKREILEMHSIEMEKAFWWSVPSETMVNGEKERSTLGIIPAIRGGYTGHGGLTGTVSNYATEPAWSGQSWLAGGMDWLNTELEILFRYGKRDKMAFCGSGTLLYINQLIQNGGDFTFLPDTEFYGLKIKNWVTVHGTIGLITHPLFSQEPTTRNIMVIIEPENLKYRFIKNRDTKYISEAIGSTNTGYSRRDGITEEYLTEAGLEYHFPNAWGYFSGFGAANTAS